MIGQYYSLIHSMGSGASAIDTDAQAFITAAAITDSTQQSAINTLVTDLKGYGLWTKLKAIYPFVGGTASSHKWNLKDPRDLDAAYRLVFSGGWTHSSTGALPNGTNAYADTKLTPSYALSQNNIHVSYYSRTNISFTDALIGCSDSSYSNGLYLIPKNSPNTEFTRINQSSFATLTGHSSTYGMFLGNRIVSTSAKSFRNGSLINTININSSGLSSNNVYIGSANVVPQQYTSCECAFASIGDGLTDTEASNFYTAVQAFQTTLGRQV